MAACGDILLAQMSIGPNSLRSTIISKRISTNDVARSLSIFPIQGCVDLIRKWVHADVCISYSLGKNKPRGLQAARKLRTHRRENRWADKQYKKRALGTAFKSSPFAGASHVKGIVLEKLYVCYFEMIL